jgi:hypothetical protein
MIPRCQQVTKTDTDQDRQGVDYIAHLRGGDQLFVDAKARDKGASRYWRAGPELALEVWSVRPCGTSPGVLGWTLTDAKHVDLILFTFDPIDSDDAFLISFPLLRAAFLRNGKAWQARFKTGFQDSGSWESECLFVPIDVVIGAINGVSRGKVQAA